MNFGHRFRIDVIPKCVVVFKNLMINEWKTISKSGRPLVIWCYLFVITTKYALSQSEASYNCSAWHWEHIIIYIFISKDKRPLALESIQYTVHTIIIQYNIQCNNKFNTIFNTIIHSIIVSNDVFAQLHMRNYKLYLRNYTSSKYYHVKPYMILYSYNQSNKPTWNISCYHPL